MILLQSGYDFEVVKRSLKSSASKYLKYVLNINLKNFFNIEMTKSLILLGGLNHNIVA